MILLIDNYDSFVYNLYQYFKMLNQSVRVIRNDQISIKEIKTMNPDAIVLSPGPCTPSEAGICVETVREFGISTPIMGICLGHQSIAYAFGANIKRAKVIMHAKTSRIDHDQKSLFQGIPNPFVAMRYHSLIVEEKTLSEDFIITARALDDQSIMGIRHRQWFIEGIQFHPESIMTPEGFQIIKNFIDHVKSVSS